MRLERESGKNLIHINEDEIGKTWQTGVDVEEVNISSEEERRICKTGEDGTESRGKDCRSYLQKSKVFRTLEFKI